jgi:hypothetical protein
MQVEGLGKLKNSTSSGTLIGDRPACSIVPQPATLTRAYSFYCSGGNCYGSGACVCCIGDDEYVRF